MTAHIALRPDLHGALKLNPARDAVYADGRHLLPLYAAELSRAMMEFPILITRLQGRDDLALSAMTSFAPGRNAYITDGAWQAGFQSADMQVYPFGLIRGADGAPELAIDQTQPAFLTDEGVALFDAQGAPALWTSQIKAQLLANLEDLNLTQHFLTQLAELNLICELVITLHQADGESQKINGLHTIHEDRLKSLSGDALAMLNQRGFLGPAYAILFSLHQLNTLIHRHNALSDTIDIQRISLQLAKDMHAAV